MSEANIIIQRIFFCITLDIPLVQCTFFRKHLACLSSFLFYFWSTYVPSCLLLCCDIKIMSKTISVVYNTFHIFNLKGLKGMYENKQYKKLILNTHCLFLLLAMVERRGEHGVWCVPVLLLLHSSIVGSSLKKKVPTTTNGDKHSVQLGWT